MKYSATIILFILLIVSCISHAQEKKSVVGKWALYKTKSPAGLGEFKNPYRFIEFNSDGSYINQWNQQWLNEPDVEFRGNYKIQSDTIYFYNIFVITNFRGKPFADHQDVLIWNEDETITLISDYIMRKKIKPMKDFEYYRRVQQ